MQNVKVFGERNTGTNALTRIIHRNSASRCLPSKQSEVDPERYEQFRAIEWHDARAREEWIDHVFAGIEPRKAWKHCAANFEEASQFDGCLVLFTVRHPASWIVSLFDRPYHQLGPASKTIAEFLKAPWKTVARERLGEASFLPLELYTLKLESYLALAAKLSQRGVHYHFVRLEDLVLRQEDVFRSIAPHLNDVASGFMPLNSSTKQRDRTLEDYQSYYGAEAWRDRLAGIEGLVDAAVDWSKWARFGYWPLDQELASDLKSATGARGRPAACGSV